jgi:hypothetical protein
MAVLAIVPILGVSTVWYYARTPDKDLSQPKQWDPRVAAIAEFVARERGLPFEHPVTVEFLTSEQYRDAAIDSATTSDEADPGTASMTDDEFVAEFRALGLISGQVDLDAVGDTMVGSGTLAFYSPRDQRVRVRGTDMTPRLRVTLAHELTHALQDQYFDLAASQAKDRTVRPIVEGDARRIEQAYATTVLTAAEQEQMTSADEAGRSAYETQLATSNVPSVLSTSFELPYAIGPQFVAIVAAKGGNAAVDALIRRPPHSEVTLLDPLRAGVETPVVTVDSPELPAGADVLDRSPMGAGLLFLLLGERLEPSTAFDAASSWQGDTMVVWRQDGRVCVDANFVNARNTVGGLTVGMNAWAEGMPPEAGAVVSGDPLKVRIHACDPGADVAFAVTGRTEQTLRYVAIRSEMELELLRDAHMTSERSACMADEAARTLSAADLAIDDFQVKDDSELLHAMQRASSSC